jgi:hypothetical protein
MQLAHELSSRRLPLHHTAVASLALCLDHQTQEERRQLPPLMCLLVPELFVLLQRIYKYDQAKSTANTHPTNGTASIYMLDAVKLHAWFTSLSLLGSLIGYTFWWRNFARLRSHETLSFFILK